MFENESALIILSSIRDAITENTLASVALADTTKATTARHLDLTAKRLAEANNRAKWMFRGIAGLLICILVLALVLGYNQRQGRKIIDSTNRSADIIRDCTDPTGECFKRSAVQQQAAIKSIVDQVNADNKVADHILVQELACVLEGRTANDCIAQFEPTTTTTTGG
jgi:hypothetical protein